MIQKIIMPVVILMVVTAVVQQKKASRNDLNIIFALGMISERMVTAPARIQKGSSNYHPTAATLLVMLRNGLVMEIATIQIIRVDATGMAAIAAVPKRTISTAHTVNVKIQSLKNDHTACYV